MKNGLNASAFKPFFNIVIYYSSVFDSGANTMVKPVATKLNPIRNPIVPTIEAANKVGWKKA